MPAAVLSVGRNHVQLRHQSLDHSKDGRAHVVMRSGVFDTLRSLSRLPNFQNAVDRQ